jgi:hypothetical protein
MEAQYDLEDDCDNWCVDSFHLWEDNYFHLLFDNSTPHYAEKIIEGNQKAIIINSAQLAYSPMVLFLPNPHQTVYNYVENILDMDGSTYLDPHDCGGNWESNIQPFITPNSHQLEHNLNN